MADPSVHHASRPIVGDTDPTRRKFLRSTLVGAAATVAAAWTGGCATFPRSRRPAPRIAIVGGGLAGLSAAFHLKDLGFAADVYEGASRLGGRVFSANNLIGDGLTTELGGEFIDTNHDDVLAFCRLFDLPLIDVAKDDPNLRDALFFQGRHLSEQEIVAAFVPLAKRMAADMADVDDIITFHRHGNAQRLDQICLRDYLHQIGATGPIAELLNVGYTTEYGLDTSEQSALNLLMLIDFESTNEFHIFGDSDERFRIQGGNARLIHALAKTLGDRVHQQHRLTRILQRGPNEPFVLSFDRLGAPATQITADYAILAIPFTTLRAVDLQVALPTWKRRAIAELGYGTSTKILVGFQEAYWRRQGFNGNVVTDEALQTGWDHTRMQQGPTAGYTFFLGGQTGLQADRDTAAVIASEMCMGLENALPGALGHRSGIAHRFHWPSYEWTRGGYACYRPGQWTSIAGAEAHPIGRLYFAGEHCSADFQGFMNGAVQTGLQAAKQIACCVQGIDFAGPCVGSTFAAR